MRNMNCAFETNSVPRATIRVKHNSICSLRQELKIEFSFKTTFKKYYDNLRRSDCCILQRKIY